MPGLKSKASQFLRGPQGRAAIDKAKRYARSPEGRRRVESLRTRFARRR